MLLLSPRQLENPRLARAQGRVAAEERVAHFALSPRTIRKDLNDLCDRRC